MNDYSSEDIYDRISIRVPKKSSGLKRIRSKSPLDIEHSMYQAGTYEFTITDDGDRDIRHDNFELLNDKVESMNQKLHGQGASAEFRKVMVAENGNGNAIGNGHGQREFHSDPTTVHIGQVRVADTSREDLQYLQNRNRVYDARDQVSRNSDHSTSSEHDKSPAYSKDSNSSTNANISDRFVPANEFEHMVSNRSLNDDTIIKLNEKLALAIAGKVGKRHYLLLADYAPALIRTKGQFAKFLIINFNKLNIKKFIKHHATKSKTDYLMLLTNFRLFLYSCVYNQARFWENKFEQLLHRLHVLLASPDNVVSILDQLPKSAPKIKPPVAVPKTIEPLISVPQIQSSYKDSPTFPNSSSFHPRTKFVSKMTIPRYVYRRLDLDVPKGASYPKLS